MNPLWHIAKHYIAGETVEEAIAVAKKLKSQGLLTTLDILGEHVRTRFQAEKVVGQYKGLLDTIRKNRLHANISVKLTHLGLPLGAGFCTANLARLVDAARHDKSFVYLDMENAEYVSSTI